MSGSHHHTGRIGRGGYWKHFLLNGLAVALLFVGIFAAAVAGSGVLTGLLILLIAALGIYFRVIQMRRCRDIGWPTFLPWAFLGAHKRPAQITGAPSPREQQAALGDVYAQDASSSSSHDDAIARALAAYKSGNGNSQAQSVPEPAPIPIPRAAAFGRKGF